MGKTTKILLALSIGGLTLGLVFVTGLVNVETLPVLYVALPAGAILFGLFLISRMLEKETGLYDQEQRKAVTAADAANARRDENDSNSSAFTPLHARRVFARQKQSGAS